MEGEPFDRRLSRADMLRLAALAAGAGVVAGPAAAADAAVAHLTKESGRLQVMDWAGYGTTAATRRTTPTSQVPAQQAAVHANGERVGRARRSSRRRPPRSVPPLRRLGEVLRQERARQPWNPKLIPNFKHLNPFMVKAGQYKGKQYGIPDDWGFDAILYRKDKVHPKARSWGLLRRAVQGQDRLVRRPRDDRGAGLYPGEEPLEPDLRRARPTVNFLKKKNQAHEAASGRTRRDLWQAFRCGDVWIAYAWPNDWVQMRKKFPVVYMHPKREADRMGRHVHAVKNTPRRHLAHAYVDAWSSKTPASGWRTTMATGTRTPRPGRARASCSRLSSSRTRKR